MALTEYTTRAGAERKGVCSTWLSERGVQHPVGDRPTTCFAFVRKSTFKLPTDHGTPLVMVGPGTGLAPFRGFLQRRELLRKGGAMREKRERDLVFFGCRHREHDYIYQEELEKWRDDGQIHLHTAFSREGQEKDYVQHRMEQEEVGRDIWRLLSKEGGVFYICGDANKMEKDVHSALVGIVAKYGGMSQEEAEGWVHRLHTEEKRLLKDTWY